VRESRPSAAAFQADAARTHVLAIRHALHSELVAAVGHTSHGELAAAVHHALQGDVARPCRPCRARARVHAKRYHASRPSAAASMPTSCARMPPHPCRASPRHP
jgi:hypothetical protein